MTSADVELLGPACTDWNDFVGTAAADDLELSNDSGSLYQLAGLSPILWFIAAVDICVGEDGCRVVVYAFDRRPADVGSYADLLELADQWGQLPVAAFTLDLSSAADGALATLFRRVTLRLVARGLKDVPLVVTDTDRR